MTEKENYDYTKDGMLVAAKRPEKEYQKELVYVLYGIEDDRNAPVESIRRRPPFIYGVYDNLDEGWANKVKLEEGIEFNNLTWYLQTEKLIKGDR